MWSSVCGTWQAVPNFLESLGPTGLMCHILSCKSKDEKLVFSVVLGATG